MKRNPFGTVLICLGLVLVLGGLALVGFNLWTDQQSSMSSQAALDVLTQRMDIPERAETPAAPGTLDLPAPSDLPPAYLSNPHMELPVTEVDGVAYIGYLELPTLGLTLPVIGESTTDNLKLAPCRFFGSPYLDDLVIGAHNYRGHFGSLSGLFSGDPVIFTDMAGNVFVYEVADFEVLEAYEGSELCNGQWDLSLFTCTVSGRTRLTVRCDRVN